MGTLFLPLLSGLLFVAWGFMMFRTLFAQRRRVAARTGKMFPGVKDSLTEWRHWWQDPARKVERRLLIFLTLALLSTTVLMAVLAPAG